MGLRVAHFYKHFLAEGGMPRETLLLARAMARCESVDRVFVYCLWPGNGKQPRSANDEHTDKLVFRTFYVPKLFFYGKWNIFIPNVFRSWIAENTDHIDIALLTSSFIAEHFSLAKALCRANIPYILSIGEAFNPNTFWGLKGLKKKVWHALFERHVVEQASALRLYSDIQKEHLSRFGHRGTNIFVAKEGVDWENIPEDLRGTSNGVLQSPPVFGYLGRLDVWKKGIDLLFGAFSQYKKSGGSGSLVICGPGDRKTLHALRALLIQHNILASTSQIGPLYGREKLRFLKSISLLCVPSRHEGIPRVIREALAVGCPVLVTENTNMDDVVKETLAGFAVKSEVSSIARALSDFDSLPTELRVRLSQNAYSLARKLDWNSIAREYVKILQEVIK